MITVTFFEDAAGEATRIQCAGHADYAPEGQDDIVCAAVSAVMQMTAIGLRQVRALGTSLSKKNGEMFLEIERGAGSARLAYVMVMAAEESLRAIGRSYNERGSEYVRVLRVRR